MNNMTKRILYSETTGQVLQWQDTEHWNYADAPTGTAIEPVNDEQWERRNVLKWFIDGLLGEVGPTANT